MHLERCSKVWPLGDAIFVLARQGLRPLTCVIHSVREEGCTLARCLANAIFALGLPTILTSHWSHRRCLRDPALHPSLANDGNRISSPVILHLPRGCALGLGRRPPTAAIPGKKVGVVVPDVLTGFVSRRTYSGLRIWY